MSSTAIKNEVNELDADMRPFFVKANPSGAEEIAPGIKRQILGFGDTLMGVRVWFSKGAVGEVHSHHHAQMAFVAEGKFKVMVDGNEAVLSAGDSFYVPPHAPHGAVCLEAGVLIDVFSPAREDFLSDGNGY